MIESARFFSADYQTARKRFCDAARAAGAQLDTLPLAAQGPQNGELAIDVAWFGAAVPRRVFVHSSGLHGVEGFAGSAIQLQWLTESMQQLPTDAAIVLTHMLNPYGAAWLRRVNENNVDLNRNFGDFAKGDGKAAREYRALDALLNPRSPPRVDAFYPRAMLLVMLHGMTRLRDIVIGGQTVNPRGLFYRGERREPGPATYEAFLAPRLAEARTVVAIDVHTGYGRYAEDTLVVDASPRLALVNQRMREAFGAQLAPADGSNDSYHVSGTQQHMYLRLAPRAKLYLATQEFGTLPPLRVLTALRAENRWHHYGTGAFEHAARRHLLAAFCPTDEGWRRKILARGREVISQACALAFDETKFQNAANEPDG